MACAAPDSNTTALTALPSVSMVMTTPAPVTAAAGVSAQPAPRVSSGWAFWACGSKSSN